MNFNIIIKPSFYLYFNTTVGIITIILNIYSISYLNLSSIMTTINIITIIIMLILIILALLNSISITKINPPSNTYRGYTKEQAIEDYTAELKAAKNFKKNGTTLINASTAGEELANNRNYVPIDEYIQYWATKLEKIKNDTLSPEDANY